MNRNRAIAVAVAATIMLGTVGVADAGVSRKVEGQVKGDARSVVKSVVRIKQGTPKRLLRLRFNRVRAACEGGGRARTSAKFARISVRRQAGKFRFADNFSIETASGERLSARVHGKVRRNGKRIAGRYKTKVVTSEGKRCESPRKKFAATTG